MSVVISDEYFGPDDWPFDIHPYGDLARDPFTTAIDIGNADDLSPLAGKLDNLLMIRVAFPSFSDGRGFTQAARLRMMGYKGRLRACGHILADQYAMARRSGFDEVEIPDELAERQPENQWRFRADWRTHNYQSRLKG